MFSDYDKNASSLQHCLLVCFPQMGKNKRKTHLTLTNRFLLNNDILIEKNGFKASS